MAIQEILCTLFKLGASCYSMPIDKLLIEYLLVPSVILILFLYFAVGFVLRGFNSKLKGLLSIVMYIVVVYSGLYSVFAPFAYSYLFLMIILLMAGFFVERLVSREWASAGFKGAGKLYKKLKEKIPSEKDLRKLIALYNTIENEIVELTKKASSASDDEKKRYERLLIEAEEREKEVRWNIINAATDLKEKKGLSKDLEDEIKKIGIKI
ncbi:MAG: hypothetical protein DRP10_01855 [Candidatus Aenigmatarchaeota archaeon]|nr:MAG: hypothetical protein DRP10_01855 [Candidatus Aenigmarchaeota archaeon]